MEYKGNIWIGIVSLLVGVALVLMHKVVPETLVVILGTLFVVTGGLNVAMVVRRSKYPDKAKRASFSGTITSLAAAILGIWMICAPKENVTLIITLFGIFAMLAAGYQLFGMLVTYRVVRFPLGFYALPVAVLLCGLFMIVSPQAFVSGLVIFMGVTLIVYAIALFLQSFAISSYERAYHRNIRQNGMHSFDPKAEVPYIDNQNTENRKITGGNWPADHR